MVSMIVRRCMRAHLGVWGSRHRDHNQHLLRTGAALATGVQKQANDVNTPADSNCIVMC